MPSTLINMGRGQARPNPTLLYQVPSGIRTVLSEVLLTSNGEQCEVDLWLVPKDALVKDDYRIQHALTIGPGENRYLTLATVMISGDRLYLAATTGKPTFIASGMEVDQPEVSL